MKTYNFSSVNHFFLFAGSVLIVLMLFTCSTVSHPSDRLILDTPAQDGFTVFDPDNICAIRISSKDFAGIRYVASDLQEDIFRVSGIIPDLIIDDPSNTKFIILAGTMDTSPPVDDVIRKNRVDLSPIRNKRESFIMQVTDHPTIPSGKILLIIGSDNRGTIYGMYHLSEQLGVSPWYWWADVPAKKRSSAYLAGRFVSEEPPIQYRGIFINDEAPALAGWVQETFGGFNAQFYERVFELILRLKGNFLWPAMWGRAFYDDDPVNPVLADEYGVVIGTSHHEPMMRAHDEWRRYGTGPWNYEKNPDSLRQFWTEGIERMGKKESIVTLGMRGDGDEPMTEEANIALLQRIVTDQRNILVNTMNKPLDTIPQVWALYKEVQEYYDKGMRVPEDITLLLCDDNWGNIRKLPGRNEHIHKGGYGIYYHYDYVGGPRNYKWLNTNQISRVWEQMHLAYRYGVHRIWIVNVGDIKPVEFPISFFLDYAWNPGRWPAERLPAYSRQWAEQQFGPGYAADIATLLDTYTRFNSRRKPELLGPETYSLSAYREAETIVHDYNALQEKAFSIYDDLDSDYRDAFYQLVLHPIEACANLNKLYVTTAKNHLYAAQGRNTINQLAQTAESCFQKDAAITRFYNDTLAEGKWSHMMDQTHIGYTYWQQPPENAMPEVIRTEVPEDASMGVSIEGSSLCWPDSGEAVLPEFDPYNNQTCFIDIFNKGQQPFQYMIQTAAGWIETDTEKSTCTTEERISISINWKKAPPGTNSSQIRITGSEGTEVPVTVRINNRMIPREYPQEGFIESNGYVSIEAAHFTGKDERSEIKWLEIPGLGRTHSAMTAIPVTMAPQKPGKNGIKLEYRIYFYNKGMFTVYTYLSPTLNFHNTDGLKFAVSFDDQPPQSINMHAPMTFQDWEESVRNNIVIKPSDHYIEKPGWHTLNYWLIDPGVAVQKLVIETTGMKPSYLGPPESYRMK